MKRVTMLLWGAALLAACSSNDKVQESIPGTYVRSVHAKTLVLLDTVMIWHEGDRTYHILHKLTQRKLSGKQRISWARKRETWVATYMPDKQILVVKDHGLILTFNLDRQLLLVNGEVFRRTGE